MAKLTQVPLSMRMAAVIVALLAPMVLLSLYLAEAQRQRELQHIRTHAMSAARAAANEYGREMMELREHLRGIGLIVAERAPRDCQPLLKQAVASRRALYGLAVANMNGSVMCASDGLSRTEGLKDREYFRLALQGSPHALSEATQELGSGRWTVVAAETIPGGPAGKNVVLGALDAEWLQSVVSDTTFPARSIVSVVDRDGRIIARVPEGAKFAGKQFLEADSFRKAVAQSREGYTESAGLDGVQRVIAYAAVPNADLYVRVGLPTDAVAAAGRHTVLASLYVVAAVLSLALGTAWIASRRLIIRPIKQLTEAATRLRAGDLSARTGLRHDDSVVGGLARKLDELAAHGARVTRALHALSGGNQTLLRERDEASLLSAMCKVAVERGGYVLAFVNYARHDERKSIETVCHAGNDLGFIATLKLTWEDSERGRGTVGTAIRTGQPVVFRSVAADERFSPWREEALKRGFRSLVSLPLRVEGSVIGTFTLIAGEEDAFDEEEMKLLLEMAADLSFGIEVLRSNAKRAEAEEAARRGTTHDRLTGLPGRIPFLHAADAAARSGAASFGVIVAHVENLQELHDGLGYDPANAAILECAAILKREMTPATVLARPANDEFALLLPRADATALADLAQRLRNSFELNVSAGGVPADVRVNIGATLFPVHGDEPEMLLRRASIAAKEAQHTATGFALYSGSSERENPTRLTLAVELRHAIAQRTLLLHYQPKVALGSGTLCGAEALIRWPHPQKGMISPAEFVPVAEQTGLIRPLTTFVVEFAVRQLSFWRESEMPVAVNLSPRNLFDPRLVEHVEYVLAAWKVNPSRLEFEITESALASDPQKARLVLTRLRDLGCKLYIDDFGTGYSSLSYLVSLPVHALKIDRSFVQQMLRGKEARLVVSSIIRMARGLGLQTVAEGVETEDQAKALHDFGCDQAQGYFFGKPVAAEEFKLALSERRTLPKTTPAEKPARRKPTVLVVDDSPIICEMLQLHLEMAGYRVLLAADGDAAIRIVRESKPDLTIVDIDMPNLSGDEFVVALRSDEATTGIPVIFLSSHEDLAEHAKLLNAVAYLPKPVKADHLLEVVALHVL